MPYNPAHDEVTDPALLLDFIARHPLAMLVTHDGITPDADQIPLLALSGEGDLPQLIGHVARGNRLWEPGRHEGTTLAVFGPVEHYVSPTWYPSKAEHHRVVPTWNYLVVHAWGRLEVHDDPKWVRQAVARLTTTMESGRPEPWRMGMAPADYLDEQIGKIVGISMQVERLVGRFKVSAHRNEADRLGARDGIRAAGGGRGAAELAEAMTDPPQLRAGRDGG